MSIALRASDDQVFACVDEHLFDDLTKAVETVESEVSLRVRLADLCDVCDQMILWLAPLGQRVQHHVADLERLSNLVGNAMHLWLHKPHLLALYCEGPQSPFQQMLTIQDRVQTTLSENSKKDVRALPGSGGLGRGPQGH